MKNQLLIFTTILLLLATIVQSQQFPPIVTLGPFPMGTEEVRGDSPWDEVVDSDIIHEYTCYRGSPVIDGNIDDDEVWQQIPYTMMDWYQNNGPTGEEYSVYDESSDSWYGPEDCTTWFKILWDDDNLYLAVKTIDDDYYAHNATVWNNDCVQLGIHTRPPFEVEGGTGAAVNLAFVEGIINYHRPMSETHGFAWSELRVAEGNNSLYFVNDGVEELYKAIYCSVDSSTTDSIVIIWEMAFDLYSGELANDILEGAVGRFTLLNIDRDRDDDLISQAVTWGRGILKSKNMDEFTSILFSGDSPPSSSVSSMKSITPERMMLNQNYPNPFNPSTEISFSLPQSGVVTLAVYSVSGELVKILINNELKSVGTHRIKFDASNFSNGIYIYQLNVNGIVLNGKMTLIK